MEETVWAIHNFDAQEPDELPHFKVGEEIVVIEKDEGYNDGWWKGMSVDGLRIGLFPSNFVSKDPPSSVKAIEKKPVKVETPKPLARPSEWTVDQVGDWLDSLEGFAQYKDSFKEHHMDGNALISPFLDINALRELGIFALERRLFLMNKISELKRNLDQFLTPPSSPMTSVESLKSPLQPPSPAKSFSSIPGISSAAIAQKSPHRQKKRSQTVDITPMVPPSIKTLKDVLLLPPDYPGSELAAVVESCEYQGYLYKRGGHAHWSWKKRYFVLKHMTLWYFKSHAPEAKVLGLIILPSYQVLPARNTNVKNGMFTFIASHPDARTYWFRAETCQDMTNWMNAMVRASLGLPPPNPNIKEQRKQSTASVISEAEPVEAQLQKAAQKPNLGLDASIAVQMEALIKNVKELHTTGKKMPPPVPIKPGHLNYKPPMSESELARRETILDSVNLKSSMEYVLWINSVLFSTDTIFIRHSEGETEIDIPLPPTDLEPVKHLHLDITDGIHLIEFLLRLISREFVKLHFNEPEEIIATGISNLFDYYRHLTIPKPHFRVQMIDNLQTIWRIMAAEIHEGRFEYWSSLKRSEDGDNLLAGADDFGSTSPLLERLEKLNVSIEGVYQGNLEQILLLMNEIDHVFPMEDDEF